MTRALIFDSGVGGLSVVAEIRKRLPALGLAYVADDAFRPYGNKTPAQLRARLPGLLATFTEMLNPDIVVIACNTASVTALEEIRAALSVPVVGVVPAVKPAAALTQTGAIAVLGTPATIRQDYLGDLISNFASDQNVLRIGSVELVDLAERKLAGELLELARVRAALAPLNTRPDIDTVVLACTHFPLLAEELRCSVASDITFIDSGEAIARRVESLLPALSPTDTLDIAFSTGGHINSARRQTFQDYGFPSAIALTQR